MDNHDLSDLLIAVTHWFQALNRLDPDGGYHWNHPALLKWMAERGKTDPHYLEAEEVCILQLSLANKYSKLLKSLETHGTHSTQPADDFGASTASP